MKYTHKAVVLGSNYYIGLAVIRSLGREGIHVVTIDHEGKNPYGRSRYVKEALIAPHYKKNEEEFLEFLRQYGRAQEEKPVLLPTADPYVEFIDKYFYELKEYFLFPMDKKGVLTDVMDKGKLEQLAKKYDIRTPEILTPEEDDLYNKVVEKIGYPLLLKPVDSPSFVNRYREKAFTVKSERELKQLLEMTKKDGFEVFIQRIITGPETNNYNFDCYINQDGEFAYYTTEYKIRQWPNNIGASTYAAQKWIPKAAEFAMPFLKQLGLKGFCEMEMKRDDRNGQIYLIEVNVRFVNFTQMHIAIGMNTPLLTYREMVGEDIGQKIIDYDTNYRWRYLYEDIASMRGYVKKGQMTKDEIIKQNQHSPIVPSTWALNDPWPGIKFALSIVFGKLIRTFKH